MRAARPGKERYVVRLMREGRPDLAVAYMRENGLIGSFIGAPDSMPPGAQALNLQTGRVVKDDSGAVVTRPNEEPYPEFKRALEPLPKGVRYVVVARELAHRFQKIAFPVEEEDLPGERRSQMLVWIGEREQQNLITRHGRLVGQVLAVEKNPDPVQGGYRLWRKPET